MIIEVKSSKPCNIEIDAGLVIQKRLPEGFVVTDANLYNLYQGLMSPEKTFVIEPGENSKSLANYEKIIEKLSKAGEQSIIAFGGGVVGDLAGFVASTYKRGIPLIQVPTSLIAMVDSSIGGKTGINLEDLKNYLGTIYQPKAVLIDLSFLRTLPLKEFRNGLAEIIKYSHLFGKPDIEKLAKEVNKDDPELKEIIFQCCQHKARVIEIDENDKDYRHILNFGHTIGHAIELACGLSHGEAISIGMVKESELAIRLGLSNKEKLEKLKKALLANCLPIDFPHNFDLEKSIKLMKRDKKGEFVFAFDEKNYNVQLEEKIVRGALK
jgi:3-dehydroquinate synthase